MVVAFQMLCLLHYLINSQYVVPSSIAKSSIDTARPLSAHVPLIDGNRHSSSSGHHYPSSGYHLRRSYPSSSPRPVYGHYSKQYAPLEQLNSARLESLQELRRQTSWCETLWPWTLPVHGIVEYQKWARRHYLGASIVQAGVLRAAANFVAQHLLIRRGMQRRLHPSTALAMGALGATVSGLGGASWNRLLEQRLGKSVGRGKPSDAALKCLCDFTLFAPLANAAYMVGLGMLSRGESLGAACAALRLESFGRVMLLEAMLFMPYSALAFQVMPLELRPLAQSCVAAAFTIALTMMC